MKTVYIPKGETVSYENLTTECLLVEGCLRVTYNLKAKKIIGSGAVLAAEITADDIRIDELKSVKTVCQRLIAKRVETSELFVSDNAAVSCLLTADYVQAKRLSVALSYVYNVDADEIVNLKRKRRGLFRFLLASALRSLWVKLTAPDEDDVVDAEYEVKEPTPVVHLETEKENKPAA